MISFHQQQNQLIQGFEKFRSKASLVGLNPSHWQFYCNLVLLCYLTYYRFQTIFELQAY